jgi:hypothetical protein
MHTIDIGQHAGNTCAHQIVVIDHQHPNQADTSFSQNSKLAGCSLPKAADFSKDSGEYADSPVGLALGGPSSSLNPRHRRPVTASFPNLKSEASLAQTLFAATVLVVIHLLAGRLHSADGGPRSRWLSAAGGVSVAYVFLHLLPELAHGQKVIAESATALTDVLTHHAYLLALAGLACFYGLERLVKAHRRALPEHGQSHAGMFWLHIAAFSAYNGLIGYLLEHRQTDGSGGLVTFAVAMTLHLLVNDFALQSHHNHLYVHRGRWVLAASVLAGWGFGQFVELPEPVVSAAVAFIAGAIVLNVLKEELPEERNSRFAYFLLGAAGYSTLMIALQPA